MVRGLAAAPHTGAFSALDHLAGDGIDSEQMASAGVGAHHHNVDVAPVRAAGLALCRPPGVTDREGGCSGEWRAFREVTWKSEGWHRRLEEAHVTEGEFRDLLAEQGYDEIRDVVYEPDADGELHTHEFSAKVLVLEGQFTLGLENGSETFEPGQTCDVPAGTVHAERTSALGARVLAGVKHASTEGR